jgi:hypothetical protein
MNDRTSGLLVVFEAGAHWPGWLGELIGAGGARVIVQQLGEASERFADRVCERCEGIGCLGGGIEVAVLACGDRADAAGSSARLRMLRSLADAMARTGGGRLYLTADTRQRGPMRASLCDIARDITREWQDAGVTASVRFGDGRMTTELVDTRVA